MSILAVVVLIVLHGVMEFAHAALFNVRRTPLRDRADDGDRTARRLLALTDDPARFTITKHMFLMAVRFAIAVVATVNLAEPFIRAQDLGSPVRELGFVLTLFVTALITYLFGDLIPSALGIAYADQTARWFIGPVSLLMTLLRPLTALMIRLDRAIAHAAHGEELGKAVTEEEIKTLVEEAQDGGALEDAEKEMIYSVLDFGETLAREVMIPRPDMVAVETTTPLGEALRVFIDSGHSRIPAYEDSMDDIKGLLYAKDLLTLWTRGAAMDAPIQPYLRPAYFVPETKRADMLFKEMQERKVHIAIIVDEYGGTAGLATIEDLIEEIVGDIRDEYDIHEEAEYTPLGEREWLVDGGMNVGDLNDLLETDLPTEENDSIGGYIYSTLGRVPEIGETLDVPDHFLTLRIEAIENRRIRKVFIRQLEKPTPEEIERAEAEADKAEKAERAERASGDKNGGDKGRRSTVEIDKVPPVQ